MTSGSSHPDLATVDRILQLQAAGQAGLSPEGEELFLVFMSHLPAAAFIKDETGRTLFANPYLQELLGFRNWEGKSTIELLPGPMGSRMSDDDRKALTQGVLEVQETMADAKGNVRTFKTLKFPIHIDGKPALLGGIAVEITELKRAEAEKEKLQAQLLHSQKMESVGRLAGGVAHDFNNMLQVILGNLALVLEEAPPSGQLREDLLEIKKAAERSAALTRQLLAFARRQIVSPRLLDLNATVASMLRMLQRLIGEGVHLDWHPTPDLWPVNMDPAQIDEIIANLTVNARDAIDGQGRITVETFKATLDDTYARTHAECVPGDYVVLAVSDTGRGIDRETQAHLFEPFFTTKGVGEGAGLGLATVYGIVKQNAGLISVYSEPGQGTTFKIYLPRAEQQTRSEGATEKAGLRGTETVLLVEDEEQILSLGRRVLEHHGYTVLACHTPAQALKSVESHPGPIDLLVTDVVMPGMNGRELRDKVIALKPGVRCVFMSGYTDNVIAHHGVLEEDVQFLQKPFTTQILTRKVREVLDRP